MVEFVERMFAGWGRIIRAAERSLVDNIAATVPWLAPIAPAYMAYHNTHTVFGWPSWVAWTVALAVEGLGLSAISTAFRLWEWNDSRRVSDQPAPIGAALAAVGTYTAVVIIVNVMLDGGGVVERLAKAILSLLSLVAGVVLALRSQQARREAAREREREERRAARMGKIRQDGGENAESGGKVSGKLPVVSDLEFSGNGRHRDWRMLSREERMRVASCRRSRDVMDLFGVPERTARNWMARAREEFGVVGEVAAFNQSDSQIVG